MEKIYVVDKLRGVASLFVVLFHLICVSGGYIQEGWATQIFYFGKFGVHFFFVISGFVITFSMVKSGYVISDFFTFLKKRLIRIEPPYLVMVALISLFLLFRAWTGLGQTNKEILPSIPQILLHIGYLIPFSGYSWLSIVFWTLAIEFQFYLLFSLALPILKKNIYLRSGFAGIMCLLSFYTHSDDNFLYWSPVFILGIYLAFLKCNLIQKSEFYIVSIACFCFVFIKYETAILYFTAFPAAVIFLNRDFRSKLLDFLGRISYSLYLSHTLIGFTILNLAIRFQLNGFMKPLIVTLALGSTILFSYVLYIVVERPFKNIAASIKYRN